MTVICSGPDTALGVAARLSEYLDCQARALGENGFQAFAGGPMGTAMLSALVTVFVALIGYRLLLGHLPDARDGVGWVVKLGIVLALVTSWPAFQALVYRVAVDAPPDIVAVLLPASGLAGESLDERVQQAYDTLRLGLDPGRTAQAAGQAGQPAAAAQPRLGDPLPKTASLLVISTAGLAGALRIAIGFLLAVAPLAIMSLLFRGTNGLFIGWVRAVAGLALGLVGATVVTAIHLVVVEGELAHLQALGAAGAATDAVDPQALTTVVCFFALVAVVTTLAAMRMGSALRLPAPQVSLIPSSSPLRSPVEPQPAAQTTVVASQSARGVPGAAANARAAAVAEVLTTAVHREQRPTDGGGRPHAQPPGQAAVAPPADRRAEDRTVERIGVAGRRSIGRQTLSASRRDKIA